jgi:exodeoxyribonuclease VII small subunit
VSGPGNGQPRADGAHAQGGAEEVPGGTDGARAEPLTYEAAAARVEEIIRRLDSGEASLNETLQLVSEGKALIEVCARELAAVSDALAELRLDELVSRLEGQAQS